MTVATGIMLHMGADLVAVSVDHARGILRDPARRHVEILATEWEQADPGPDGAPLRARCLLRATRSSATAPWRWRVVCAGMWSGLRRADSLLTPPGASLARRVVAMLDKGGA